MCNFFFLMEDDGLLIYCRKDFICFDWCAMEYWAFSVFVSNESSLSKPLAIFCCISCCAGGGAVADPPAAAFADWPLASALTSPFSAVCSDPSVPSPPFIFNKFVKLPHTFYKYQNAYIFVLIFRMQLISKSTVTLTARLSPWTCWVAFEWWIKCLLSHPFY